jgi:MoxR-like ATPase
MASGELTSVASVREALDGVDYLADEGLATAVLLALRMARPLFLEGEPGAGKTELAKALAAATGRELVRLQCYEGIDVSQALYDWDHPRQLLHLRAVEAAAHAGSDDLADAAALEGELYTERFLIRRPLLRALVEQPSPVLLIDEIDRADDEFEAFLLELLAEWSVTVPELGRFAATDPPLTVLTSNRTREVHDALKRRCLFHWVEHPDLEREVAIVRRRLPDLDAALARDLAAAVSQLRELPLYKPPGVAETLDWARALELLDAAALDARTASVTLGAVLKQHEDHAQVHAHGLERLLADARAVAS